MALSHDMQSDLCSGYAPTSESRPRTFLGEVFCTLSRKINAAARYVRSTLAADGAARSRAASIGNIDDQRAYLSLVERQGED
jgi:hypothetical protein